MTALQIVKFGVGGLMSKCCIFCKKGVGFAAFGTAVSQWRRIGGEGRSLHLFFRGRWPLGPLECTLLRRDPF